MWQKSFVSSFWEVFFFFFEEDKYVIWLLALGATQAGLSGDVSLGYYVHGSSSSYVKWFPYLKTLHSHTREGWNNKHFKKCFHS